MLIDACEVKLSFSYYGRKAQSGSILALIQCWKIIFHAISSAHGFLLCGNKLFIYMYVNECNCALALVRARFLCTILGENINLGLNSKSLL